MVKLDKNRKIERNLGSVDLSGTISELETNKTVENLQTSEPVDKLDLSKTQKMDVIIQEPIIVHKKSKLIIPSVILVIIGVVTSIFVYLNTPTQVSNRVDAVVNTTPVENQDSVKTFTAELKKTADQTHTPYKISTEVIGGDYVLGITTYNPDNPKDLYMDYELLKPEKAKEQTTDDKVKSIQEKLKSELPTINKSIVVKDKEKVSMETYKIKDDLYQTILLYDGKPFGYVSTDKDNISTNYVTSYYVTDVAAK